MNQSDLNKQADEIEAVLARHYSPARVTGGNVTPRLVRFIAQPQPGTVISRVEGLTGEIAAALGVSRTSITRSGGALRIDVPRRDAQPVSLAAMLKRIPADRVPFCTALLGLAVDGAPLLVRFPSPDVGHILITGGASSGKTSLIVSLLLSLAYYHKPRNVKIVARGGGFDCLRDLPHMLEVDDLARLIERPSLEPRIVIAIDEPSADDLPVVRELITRGAAVGVHCLIAARVPFDLPVKVKVTADHAPGDFWADFRGQVMRFDAAYIAASEIASFIQALTPTNTTTIHETIQRAEWDRQYR